MTSSVCSERYSGARTGVLTKGWCHRASEFLGIGRSCGTDGKNQWEFMNMGGL